MVKRPKIVDRRAQAAPTPAKTNPAGAVVMAGGRSPAVAPAASASSDPNALLAPELSILATSDGGRWEQFPQFGQIGRTGLLAQTGSGLLMGGTGALRVFNPDQISIAEYDEMSLYPVIRSCLLGYALVMQTADLSVSCADASMKALVESQLLPILPQLMRETLMPAQIFGWADAETVWETRYNVPVDLPPTSRADALQQSGPSDQGDTPQRIFPYVTAIKDFVPLASNTVTLRQTAQGEFAGAVQWAWGSAFLPPSKLFHLPMGGLFRNPYGQSLQKTCYPFWVWARFLWEMTMVAVERGAAPPLIGRYPASLRIAAGVDAQGRPQTQDAGDFLLSQLTQLRSFATAVFPRQLDPNGNDLYDVKELELNAHVDWMTQVIELCQQQMMLGLFFPDKLMQSGDVGSYALAKEHTDLFSLAVKARLDEFLWHLNAGPVKQFVRFNDRKCPDATITYSAPNIEAMQAFAMAAVQAMTTGQCLVGANQDQVLVPDWQGWADDLGLKYDVVRKTDGLDAFGRPLQPGVSPDDQDHQGAVAAGMAPDGGSSGSGSGQGGFASGGGQGSEQGASSVAPGGAAASGNLPGVGSDPNSPSAQAYARDLTAHLSDVPGAIVEKIPSLSAKAMLAKQSAHYVGADIQRYSEEQNEPILAKGIHGVSLRDNEPIDTMVLRHGRVAHGVELKTLVDNKANKITMKTSAMQRKADWVKEHGVPFHTVVFDDHKVFNAGGQDVHGPQSDRQMYYKRGFGSFRIPAMHPVRDMAHLNELMDTPDHELPPAARPPKTYVPPPKGFA